MLKGIIAGFNKEMSDKDFIKGITKLDILDDGTLYDYDNNYLANFYGKLSNICPIQIDNNLSNKTYLHNRGETIGSFLYFVRNIGL